MRKLTLGQMNALLDAVVAGRDQVPQKRQESLRRAEQKLLEGIEQVLNARDRKEEQLDGKDDQPELP